MLTLVAVCLIPGGFSASAVTIVLVGRGLSTLNLPSNVGIEAPVFVWCLLLPHGNLLALPRGNLPEEGATMQI